MHKLQDWTQNKLLEGHCDGGETVQPLRQESRLSLEDIQAVRPVILLIENDDSDVFMFRRALAKQNFSGTLRVVSTIHEARRYLTNYGEFSDKGYYPSPDLIVSDMNLGPCLGNDLLEWIRQNAQLTNIPFVFYSGSYLPPDKIRARELGAQAFYTKSGHIDHAVEQVAAILKSLPQKVDKAP